MKYLALLTVVCGSLVLSGCYYDPYYPAYPAYVAGPAPGYYAAPPVALDVGVGGGGYYRGGGYGRWR